MSPIDDILKTLDAYANGADDYCLVSQAAAMAIRTLQAELAALRSSADALREIEEWLRAAPHRFASASQLIDSPERIQVRLDTDGWRTLTLETGPTLSAAILAALARAKEAK